MTLKTKAIKQFFHIIVLFTAYNLKWSRDISLLEWKEI